MHAQVSYFPNEYFIVSQHTSLLSWGFWKFVRAPPPTTLPLVGGLCTDAPLLHPQHYLWLEAHCPWLGGPCTTCPTRNTEDPPLPHLQHYPWLEDPPLLHPQHCPTACALACMQRCTTAPAHNIAPGQRPVQRCTTVPPTTPPLAERLHVVIFILIDMPIVTAFIITSNTCL